MIKVVTHHGFVFCSAMGHNPFITECASGNRDTFVTGKPSYLNILCGGNTTGIDLFGQPGNLAGSIAFVDGTLACSTADSRDSNF